MNENKGLTFAEYQERTSTTAVYRDNIEKLVNSQLDLDQGKYGQLCNIINLAYVGLGLGEAGEIQGKIKKILRDSGGIISNEKRNEIGKELGDILWYVSQTCNELGISLGLVAQGNLDKLQSRKERGVLSGSGDNR